MVWQLAERQCRLWRLLRGQLRLQLVQLLLQWCWRRLLLLEVLLLWRCWLLW